MFSYLNEYTSPNTSLRYGSLCHTLQQLKELLFLMNSLFRWAAEHDFGKTLVSDFFGDTSHIFISFYRV